jgi:hypothetical protein
MDCWLYQKSRIETEARSILRNSHCSGEIKSRPANRTAFASSNDSLLERSAQSLVATAAAAVFPVHLKEEVESTQSLIEVRAVGSDLCGAKAEVALIGVFLPARIEPGIQVRIRNGFFCLMRNYIGHSVSSAAASGNAVRASGLGFAAVGALVNVSDEGPLNVGAVQRLTSVEAAELGAESALFDV